MKHNTKTQGAFSEMYAQLNPEQKEAVEAIEGPVMVLAGPGTGKTQVLAMRIARILQVTQMDPWNVLCLTFTESGVVAMRERLVKIIGTAGYYVRIHTFHSFCNEVIQAHPDIFALKDSWQALSDIERVELLRELLDKLAGTSPLKPFGAPYLYLKDVAGAIQTLKQESISPEEFKQTLSAINGFLRESDASLQEFFVLKPKERTEGRCDAIVEDLLKVADKNRLPLGMRGYIERLLEELSSNAISADDEKQASKMRTAFKQKLKKWRDKLDLQLPRQMEVARVYDSYQGELEQRGRYDFEDMIFSVTREFKKNDQLLAQYQEQYQYVLVDEYQDTNGAQNEVVQLLGSWDDQPNIFVVGDDKQSIYRFQGASLNNMLDFYNVYKKHIKVVSLRNNYRSQAVVLRSAGELIANNRESIVKYIPNVTDELSAKAGKLERKIEKSEFDSEGAENVFITRRVKELLEEGVPAREIAVLFRYNRDGQELVAVMQKLGIPVRLEAGENALDDIHVEQFVKLLRLISNPRRDDLLADMLWYGWWDLNELDVIKLLQRSARDGRSMVLLASDEQALKDAGIGEPEKILKVAGEILRWRKQSANTTLQHFLHDILTQSGWLDYVLRRQDKLSSLQKMATLLNEAKNLNATSHNVTLGEFVRRFDLLREHDISLDTDPWYMADDAVRLMTAHKAKGLEFEHVFMIRMNNKHWGNNPDVSRLKLPHGLAKYDFIMDQENNEDERRLCYVAMTRAKQGLYMTRSRHTASGRQTEPSIFWVETPDDECEIGDVHEGEQEVLARLAKVELAPVPDGSSQEIRDWVKHQLDGYVMSVTHLNNYLECPRKFYVRNILRVPDTRSVFQALGSCVHDALERYVRAVSGGDEPTLEDLLGNFSRRLDREVLTEVDKKDTLETGLKILEEYYAKYSTQLGQSALVEYDFKPHCVVVEGVSVTGKIDKVLPLDGKLEKGSPVAVVDYKTGNPDKAYKKMKPEGNYYRQMVFYQLLCDESPQFPYKMEYGEFDFVQKSTAKGLFVKKKIVVSEEDKQELREQIRRVWDEIVQLNFLTGEKTPFCGECEYCEQMKVISN